MSRWSPTTRAGMPNPHEGVAQALGSIGSAIGGWQDRRQAQQDRVRADARRAWEDELEGRRYTDTQERLNRAEQRLTDKDRADRLRQTALDGAAGIMQFDPTDDRVNNAMIGYDPTTGAEQHIPEYKPLGGGYYQDARRTPEYTEGLTRNRNTRIGELAGGANAGINPELAAELGPGYVQSALTQHSNQAFQREQATQSAALQRELMGMRNSASASAASRPGRSAPMSIVQAIGEVDTLYGLANSIADGVARNPKSVGAVGMLPGAVQAWGTGDNGPNALGRAMSALPGITDESFGPEQTAIRAQIADLKSRLLLARSGAAVTASEYQRLVAMLPSDSEPPESMRAKLQAMAAILQEKAQFLRNNYGEDQGYYPTETINLPGSGVPMRGSGAPDPTGGFFDRYRVTP